MKRIIVLSLACVVPISARDITSQSLHQFITANFHQFNSNAAQAEYWYTQVATSQNPETLVGYIPYLQATGKHQEIVKLIPLLGNRFADNLEIQRALAHALEKTGKVEQAHERLVALSDKHKSDQELTFKVAQMYMMRKEPENALLVIDKLLNNSPRKPNNFIFHFLRSQIYLQLNQKDKAYVCIKTCIETYPKFDKGWLLYAAMEEQAGKLADAVKGYTTFLETTSERQRDIEQHLIQLAFKHKFAHKHHAHMASNRHCISKAMELFEQRQYSKAIETLDACIAQKPDNKQAHLAKIELLMAQKKFDLAINELKQVIFSGDDTQLWLKTLHLMTKAGLAPIKAVAILSEVEKRQPTLITPVLYKADIYLRTNNTQAALKELTHACSYAPEAPLHSKILYQIAAIQYEARNFAAMKKSLQTIVNLKTDYPPALNLLAYYYATKGKDYEQADLLMTKALEKDPHNPHFLDTQALILYKKQSYTQALSIQERIARQCPDDCTILKHLGKTQRKLGNRDQALTVIQKAYQVAHTSHEKSHLKRLINRWSSLKS